jgi:hypothetical protein
MPLSRAARFGLLDSRAGYTFLCLDRYKFRRHFLGLEELSCGARAVCRAFARSRTVDDG